jgi:hypothetical protein
MATQRYRYLICVKDNVVQLTDIEQLLNYYASNGARVITLEHTGYERWAIVLEYEMY